MAHQPTATELGSILEQLRAAVREQRFASGTHQHSAVEQDLQRSLDEIELHRVISAHWPLTARNPLERGINLINKVVRRLLRWYINPIVEQQNAYNDAVARTLRLLADAYSELTEQIRTPAPELPHRPPNPPPDSVPDETTALQQLIEQQAHQEPEARFIELELVRQAQQLGIRQDINAHWPLRGNTLPTKASALAQTATRRYLRWLINPIATQQTNANHAFTSALNNLIRLDAERRAEVAAHRAHKHG